LPLLVVADISAATCNFAAQIFVDFHVVADICKVNVQAVAAIPLLMLSLLMLAFLRYG